MAARGRRKRLITDRRNALAFVQCSAVFVAHVSRGDVATIGGRLRSGHFTPCAVTPVVIMTADRRLNVTRLDALLATVLACGAVGIVAQQAARPPANLPPPFPRAGAKQLLDNDRVTVWDVVWPKGQPTPLHRHPYALAGVYLEPGTRVITDADGSQRNVSNEAGGVTF